MPAKPIPALIRLVHTADIHLDTCFAGAGLPPGFGNRRRQNLRDVFHDIVKHAVREEAEALLIAGDLFEQDRVSRDTVAFLQTTFKAFPNLPVFIAPGNHDPYIGSSPYVTEEWPEHVHIFSSPEWTALELPDSSVTVHGFGFDGPDVSVNPFGTLTIPQDGRTHVAVAHGSALGHQPPGKTAYAPFEPGDAAPAGLRYLALGHFHSKIEVKGDFDCSVYYSGSPEGRGFKECGSRVFLDVSLDDTETRVVPMPASRAVYDVHTIDCSGFETAQQLIDAVRALPHSDGMARIARVTLEGTESGTWRHELGAVYDAVQPEFEYLDLVDEIVAAADFEALAREETSLGVFVRTLNEEYADSVDPERRAVLERARTIGVAAYQGRPLAVPGTGGG